ncbi:MAG: ABC transporter ATP-binding protein [Actinomycetota bacterium]
METSIRLRGLVKRYDRDPSTVPAVAGIDLDVAPGEIVALLGPNGAGKTTTLDVVLGFQAPTEGSVEVFGASPADAVRAGRVSAVLQTGGLLRDLRVGETVELIASTYPDPPPVDDVLARAGIDHLVDRKVQACSGGEQQRLRFALALLAEPDLLILDEPTAGMDVSARQEFWQAMRTEATQGRTIVFATHYLEEAEQFAERTVLLANGRIVADGPTDQVRRQAAGRIVRARVVVDRIDEISDALRIRPDVHRVDHHNGQLVVETADSDDVARYLLGPAGGHDLEIDVASLEQAFMALTDTGTAAR